jgi:gentisate 1,2-dioxygenase
MPRSDLVDRHDQSAATIHAAVQRLPAGASVPAHRHTATAVRFVLAGSGAWTIVDGVRCHMAVGDLILVPSWSWHEHFNPTDDEVVWWHALDTPLIERTGTNSYERHPEGRQVPIRGASSLLRQPWAVTDRRLTRMFCDPTRIASAEFTNPRTGGRLSPHFSCWMHRFGPALSAPPTRAPGYSMFVVLSGRGTTNIGTRQVSWTAGDVFDAAPWSAVSHDAHELTNLFELTDRPAGTGVG